MSYIADVDIDIPIRTPIHTLFPSVISASRVANGQLVKHPCGYYFETIPVDKLTNLAAIPYTEAENLDYTKIDFLHLSLLGGFKNKAEFRAMCRKEPNWDLLKEKKIVEQLFQVKNHWILLQRVHPKSIIELADVIALIRPEKRHLLDQYVANKAVIRPLLYRGAGDDKSAFRYGHSLSYSVTIVAQLNLIESTKE